MFVLAQATESMTMLEQLSPFNQIRVFTGLFVVLVLGLVMFLVIKAGAHMAKGFGAAAKRLPTESRVDQDDWANKPLNDVRTDKDLDVP